MTWTLDAADKAATATAMKPQANDSLKMEFELNLYGAGDAGADTKPLFTAQAGGTTTVDVYMFF